MQTFMVTSETETTDSSVKPSPGYFNHRDTIYMCRYRSQLLNPEVDVLMSVFQSMLKSF